jgi:hypothetical protein
MANLLRISSLLFLMLCSQAYASGMGIATKGSFASVYANESAKFSMLMWNAESDSYQVNITQRQAPDGGSVMANPEKTVLNSSYGAQFMQLPYMEDPVAATPVDIIVKPSAYSAPGRYNISVAVSAGIPGAQIGIVQERVVNFAVEIINPIFSRNQTKSESDIAAPQANASEKQIPLGQEEYVDYSLLLYATVAVAIIVVSWLLYRCS